MMVQVHMITKKIHMTILNAMDTFLQEFDSTLIITHGVIDKIPQVL